MRPFLKITTLFLICSSTIYGQSEYKHFDVLSPSVGKESPIGELIGWGDNSFFTYSSKGKTTTYCEYGNDFKLLRSKEYTPQKSKTKFNSEVYFQLGGRIYECYSMTDKSAKSNKLYYRQFNTERLIHEENEVEIFSISGSSYYSNFRGAFAQVNVSPNGEHVLIALKLPEDPDRHRKFQFLMFNRQLELQWKKEVKFHIDEGSEFRVIDKTWGAAPPKNALFNSYTVDDGENYSAFKVGNDGDIVTWGIQKTKIPKEQWGYNYQTFVYRISEQNTSYAEVGGFEHNLSDIIIQPSESGRVRLAGFYYSDTEDGAFVSYLDFETGGTFDSRYYPFTDQFRKQYRTTKKLPGYFAGHTYETKEFAIDQVIETTDGGLVLTGGLSYSYANNNAAKFVRGNIVIVHIDADGEMSLNQKIPLFQETFISTYAGYEIAYAKNKLYFIYNDNFKNVSKSFNGDKIETFVKGDNPVVVAVCDLTKDGEITRNEVWTTEQAGGMYEPSKRLSLISENRLIVRLQKGTGSARPIRVIEFK